jgi:hypothetical protein
MGSNKRVGLDMPLICIVRKDGTEVNGVPIGFYSRMVSTAPEDKTDPALDARNVKEKVGYVVFPFVQVPYDDIDEVYTFDTKGERHGGKVNCGVHALIHIWVLNREFKK